MTEILKSCKGLFIVSLIMVLSKDINSINLLWIFLQICMPYQTFNFSPRQRLYANFIKKPRHLRHNCLTLYISLFSKKTVGKSDFFGFVDSLNRYHNRVQLLFIFHFYFTSRSHPHCLNPL